MQPLGKAQAQPPLFRRCNRCVPQFRAWTGNCPTTVRRGDLAGFGPSFGGQKKKQDKAALSRDGDICPQCGQGAGERVLSYARFLKNRAIPSHRNAVFSSTWGDLSQRMEDRMKKQEEKQVCAYRFSPDTVRHIEQWYKTDAVRKNEFVEKAVRCNTCV